MCVCVCVYHILLIHLSVDGHWSFFHVLASVNNAVVYTRVNISFQVSVFVFFR